MAKEGFESFEHQIVRAFLEIGAEWMLEETHWYKQYKQRNSNEQQAINDTEASIVARRKLEGYLTTEQQERAVINALDAEDSIEELYADLRERLGAKHPLTSKAERARERVNNFRVRLIKSLNGVDDSTRDSELNQSREPRR